MIKTPVNYIKVDADGLLGQYAYAYQILDRGDDGVAGNIICKCYTEDMAKEVCDLINDTEDAISFLGIQLPVIAALLPSLVLNQIATVQPLNKQVKYLEQNSPEGTLFYVVESNGDLNTAIARCPNAKAALEICEAINGSNMTIKERDYRDFVMKLQQQREEAGVETKDMLSSTLTFLLTHGAMGLVTEAGEILDIIKKHLVYRRPLDFTKLKDECGDLLFYLTMVIMECNSNYNEIIDMNTAKLTARYSKGYSHQDANNRDLEAEKKAQEMSCNPTNTVTTLDPEKCKNAAFEKPPIIRKEPPIIRDEKA